MSRPTPSLVSESLVAEWRCGDRRPAWCRSCLGLLASSRQGFPTAGRLSNRSSGGRARWAHDDFTRINIEVTIFQNRTEDLFQIPQLPPK